jgi:hypothetical protein
VSSRQLAQTQGWEWQFASGPRRLFVLGILDVVIWCRFVLSEAEFVRQNWRQHQRGKHYIWCVASGKSTTYSVCLKGCTMLVCAVKSSPAQGQDRLALGAAGSKENRGFEGAKPSAARLSRRFAGLGLMKYEKNRATVRSANGSI